MGRNYLSSRSTRSRTATRDGASKSTLRPPGRWRSPTVRSPARPAAGIVASSLAPVSDATRSAPSPSARRGRRCSGSRRRQGRHSRRLEDRPRTAFAQECPRRGMTCDWYGARYFRKYSRTFAATWRSVILSTVCTATMRPPSFFFWRRFFSSSFASPGPNIRIASASPTDAMTSS